MGTRFRTLLAPIGVGTGDGRRFAEGAISLPATPFPFEWVREREGGHNGAVTIGTVQDAHIGTVAEALTAGWISPERVAGMDAGMMGVWASGEFLDDADRETMPRLAEDVATAMHLIENGTLGPSVDPDSFEAVPVLAGTDTPAALELVTDETKLELLITSGRVRAATLVSIPAFAETSRPLELIPNEAPTPVAALLASVGQMERLLDIAAFSGAALTGPTPITYDRETGRVFGHIATWQTCHTGYSEVCVTAPRDPSGEFASFNRFPIETADGVVWAGRITVGGRHAALSADANGAIREHDEKTVAAYVRAYADEVGIAVAGVLQPDLDEGTLAVLSRRKVSGDWRETKDGLSLVEVLALSPGPRAHSEPGFPVETFSRAGRQVALVASLSPEPEADPDMVALNMETLAARVVDEMEQRRLRQEAASVLSAMLQEDDRSVRGALLAALNQGE